MKLELDDSWVTLLKKFKQYFNNVQRRVVLPSFFYFFLLHLIILLNGKNCSKSSCITSFLQHTLLV